MNEPTIVCPSCKIEIKLNESLAAPLIEATRQQYEKALSQKETDFAKRETAIREQQAALLKEKQSIDEQVLARLKPEREKIAAEERKNARLVLTNDIGQPSGSTQRARPEVGRGTDRPGGIDSQTKRTG